MKTSLIILTVIYSLTARSQSTDSLRPINYYIHHETESPFIYKVDGKWVSKKTFKRIEKADSIYNNLNGLRLTQFRTVKGKLLYSYYSFGADRGEPFGEYKEYYDNGNLKITGQYKMPTKDSVGAGIIDGTWTFFSKRGKVIGTKNYKDGLANGEWIVNDNDGKILYKKYFKNGFSSGTWSYIQYSSKDSYSTYNYNFYKGFSQNIICPKEIFNTTLDSSEYIKSFDSPIEIEDIEYLPQYSPHPTTSDTIRYIKKGKFYIIRDGIIIQYKEYQDGEIIKQVEYNCR